MKHLSAEKQISIANIPEISAVYFSLLQCGDDFYIVGRSLKHAETIRAFCNTKIKADFLQRSGSIPVRLIRIGRMQSYLKLPPFLSLLRTHSGKTRKA